MPDPTTDLMRGIDTLCGGCGREREVIVDPGPPPSVLVVCRPCVALMRLKNLEPLMKPDRPAWSFDFDRLTLGSPASGA